MRQFIKLAKEFIYHQQDKWICRSKWSNGLDGYAYKHWLFISHQAIPPIITYQNKGLYCTDASTDSGIESCLAHRLEKFELSLVAKKIWKQGKVTKRI